MRLKGKKKCLVTGCAGNVGSNLTKLLLQKGHAVVGIDNYFSGRPENMIDFCHHPDFTFHERSITDTDFLIRLFQQLPQLSAVFHLAAVISVPYSVDHPSETMDVNHLASMVLHALANEHGCGAFVFAGSAAEYGRPASGPVKEDEAGDPLSPYGLSKYLVSSAIEESGYGCSVRFFNIYGPTRAKAGPYDGVVRTFLERTRQGMAPVIHGDGSQTRDFLFLGDAVKALLFGAGFVSGGPLKGVYNIGTGKGTTILELAVLSLRLSKMAERPVFGQARQSDVFTSVADNSRLENDCGWKPSTSLLQGLRVTFMEKLDIEFHI